MMMIVAMVNLRARAVRPRWSEQRILACDPTTISCLPASLSSGNGDDNADDNDDDNDDDDNDGDKGDDNDDDDHSHSGESDGDGIQLSHHFMLACFAEWSQ